MQQLRAQCPWKREQTHRSLARYLLEETHETLEAIEAGDDAHLAEELGDLLLQVYFHAAVAAERGAFDLDDVTRGVIAKMVRRNPHVLGTADQRAAAPADAATVDQVWQQVKATEGKVSALPETLPALLLATKTLERRAAAGRDAPDVTESSEDLGDRLLALVSEAVADGVDPEQALRDAVRRLPG